MTALVPNALLRAADSWCVAPGCGQLHAWRYCWPCWKKLTPDEQLAHRIRLRTLLDEDGELRGPG